MPLSYMPIRWELQKRLRKPFCRNPTRLGPPRKAAELTFFSMDLRAQTRFSWRASSYPQGIPIDAFGKAVRSLRLDAGLSQEEVAERGDFVLTHISRLENGRGNPTYRILEKIAAGLGVTCAEIFSLAGVFARRSER